ncbi:MarR family winged helix-turn-helix transcriptional regulator [Celerinatantimonas sp. MCCC 1A17872]|uniref:MarR family winged helix-turn-helix transcriptional regulator n=1 Tax=Celerinatantimonas sp. MCCC 1A17872 TaxID=3177514 RepID=UPI0038CB2979
MNNIEKINQVITEFYDKMSSWELSVVKETGYSLAQIHTIEVLGVHGSLKMKELAEKLGITTGTLTVQVEKLVNAQLVVRGSLPADRRAIVVQLTDAGMAIHRRHNLLHVDLFKTLMRDIEPDEAEVLLNCFVKMNREF